MLERVPSLVFYALAIVILTALITVLWNTMYTPTATEDESNASNSAVNSDHPDDSVT